jgi:hypothetical protein
MNNFEIIDGKDYLIGQKADLNINNISNGLLLNSSPMESLDVILLGCWNSGCTDKLNISHTKSIHQRLLVNLLRIYDSQRSGNRVKMFAGDNVYDVDGMTMEQVVTEGFRCFGDSEPTLLALGNHDVSAETLKFQLNKSYMETNIIDNNVSFGNWILPSAYYAVRYVLTNGTKLIYIFIDTNLLIGEYGGDVTLPADSKENMLIWLNKTLDENNTYVPIIIGHHPIFGFGHKDKRGIIVQLELSSLYKIMVDHRAKVYICADEHNLQHIYDLKNDIHMLICGSSPGSGGDETYTPKLISEKRYGGNCIELFKGEFGDEKTVVEVSSVICISAPGFLHMQIYNELITIKLVSFSKLNYHRFKELKTDCINNTNESYEIYDIVCLHKYKDVVSIYNCERYKLKHSLCESLSDCATI